MIILRLYDLLFKATEHLGWLADPNFQGLRIEYAWREACVWFGLIVVGFLV